MQSQLYLVRFFVPYLDEPQFAEFDAIDMEDAYAQLLQDEREVSGVEFYTLVGAK